MNSRRLQHALTLMEVGSFSKAAQRLHITQSALSRSIQSLEQDVGMALFDRSRSGVTATAAGRPYLQRAATLLEEMREFAAFGKELSTGHGGDVRVGLGTSVAHLVAPRLIARAMVERPNLTLSIEIAPMTKLAEDMVGQRLDFAIMAETAAHDRVIATERLAQARPALLARPGHPLHGLDRPTLAQLQDYPILVGALTLEEARELSGWNHGIVLCDNSEVLRAAALSSDAIWSTLGAAGDPENGAGALVALDGSALIDPPRPLPISLFRLRGRNASAASRFVEAIARELVGDSLGR